MSSSEARRSGPAETQRGCDKTLYDRTVVRRVQTTSRRTRRTASGLLALGLVVGSGAAALAPAQAVAPRAATAFGGFSTIATASPLKLDVFEPAIPIPTEPQFELDFSYTRVLGDSGPTTTARASAMWPGPAVGEGMKTFGDQLGLPPQLTQNGYPAQVNSSFPGDTTQASSEPFPGMVQRVNAGEKRTVAKAGYTGSGDLAEGDADGTTTSSNPLTALSSGDLSALGNILTGTTTGNNDNPVSTNPMGALSLLIDYDGMTSVSSSEYTEDTVKATATSRIGEMRLLMGLIKLTGINVVTKVTSSLDGVKTSRTVDVGGMTIAGQKFSYGPDGFTAAGSTTPAPGMPAQGADLLKMLGVAIEVPAPEVTKDGTSGRIDAEAVRITLDTKVLRSKLPSIPLDSVVDKLPDLPGQANLLKGMLLSLNTFSPKLVLHLGQATAAANTVSAFDLGGEGTPSVSTPTGTGGTGTGTGAPAADLGAPGEVPPAATTTPTTTPTENVSAPSRLPALGSIPGMLGLLGLLLASFAGWYLRRAGGLLFGAGASCTHGLKAGIPDLRKA
jgi:hypothetical protein